MKSNLIYFHRIHFPSASGQTIQVLRDYYAMSKNVGSVHLLYRSDRTLDRSQLNTLLFNYGAELTSTFSLHCITEGWFGKFRTKQKVIELIKLSEEPVIIITRTLDHTQAAIKIRSTMPSHLIKVIFELHETAIPHMVYEEQNRKVKARLSLKQERHIFSKVDGILCTAPPQLTILNKKFPNHSPAAILPNNFDSSFFQFLPKVPVKKKRSTFHMRYAGQFSIWKNTDIMFETLKYLPENFVIDIAGGKMGFEDFTKDMLFKLGQTHGVNSRINYVGFLSPTQVPSFLAEADCLLLPLGNNVQSRFFTSPIKLFEYAASNVPMVVTRQPTTASLIEDGVHAIMVKPNSPQDLATAVKYIADNSETGRKLAKNAKEWVSQYATYSRTEKYKKFLEMLIGIK